MNLPHCKAKVRTFPRGNATSMTTLQYFKSSQAAPCTAQQPPQHGIAAAVLIPWATSWPWEPFSRKAFWMVRQVPRLSQILAPDGTINWGLILWSQQTSDLHKAYFILLLGYPRWHHGFSEDGFRTHGRKISCRRWCGRKSTSWPDCSPVCVHWSDLWNKPPDLHVQPVIFPIFQANILLTASYVILNNNFYFILFFCEATKGIKI